MTIMTCCSFLNSSFLCNSFSATIAQGACFVRRFQHARNCFKPQPDSVLLCCVLNSIRIFGCETTEELAIIMRMNHLAHLRFLWFRNLQLYACCRPISENSFYVAIVDYHFGLEAWWWRCCCCCSAL